jgi:hypothetical protein
MPPNDIIYFQMCRYRLNDLDVLLSEDFFKEWDIPMFSIRVYELVHLGDEVSSSWSDQYPG